MTALQQTITQALTRPSERRVWVHKRCGGWVLFDLAGGFCLHCEAAPLHVGDYERPGRPA